MSAVSIGRQIGCIEREIAMRKSGYPRQVASGKMRASVADLEIGDMQAARATLQWCADNGDVIAALKDENARLRAELEGMRAAVERVA
jgi:hypothetical protein